MIFTDGQQNTRPSPAAGVAKSLRPKRMDMMPGRMGRTKDMRISQSNWDTSAAGEEGEHLLAICGDGLRNRWEMP